MQQHNQAVCCKGSIVGGRLQWADSPAHVLVTWQSISQTKLYMLM
jgi:hypothetical protein